MIIFVEESKNFVAKSDKIFYYGDEINISSLKIFILVTK